jgi:hypothetical protein
MVAIGPLIRSLTRLVISAICTADVAGRVRQHQVACGRQGAHQLGHDAVRVVIVGDQVQDDQQHQRHRRAEVQGPRRGPHDGRGVPQVRLHVVARTLRGAAQQGPGVQQHDGVVVGVHDPRVRGGLLRHLMGVAGHRQPGADIEELPDAALAGQVPHDPGQESPVRPSCGRSLPDIAAILAPAAVIGSNR